MTALGPSFIKAGQVLASRPDIVRADYMEELCTLQDDVPSFPDDIVSLLIPVDVCGTVHRNQQAHMGAHFMAKLASTFPWTTTLVWT